MLVGSLNSELPFYFFVGYSAITVLPEPLPGFGDITAVFVADWLLRTRTIAKEDPHFVWIGG